MSGEGKGEGTQVATTIKLATPNALRRPSPHPLPRMSLVKWLAIAGGDGAKTTA